MVVLLCSDYVYIACDALTDGSSALLFCFDSFLCPFLSMLDIWDLRADDSEKCRTRAGEDEAGFT